MSRPSSALHGRECLGTPTFVSEVLRRAEATTQDPEVPRRQREPMPQRVEDLLPSVIDALATTQAELARHPRKRKRERAILAYALRRYAGATGATSAPLLGVTAWQASALARMGERIWIGDAHLAASVERALSQAVDPQHQT